MSETLSSLRTAVSPRLAGKSKLSAIYTTKCELCRQWKLFTVKCEHFAVVA